MAREKCLHFLRIGFMRLGIGLRGNQVVEESLRSLERKHGEIDHRGPPLLAIRLPKQKPQAANQIGGIGNIRVAATKREAPDDRHAAGLEHDGLREASALAVTLEKTADANALGMIAAKTGIDPIDALKAIDETLGSEGVGTEPAA